MSRKSNEPLEVTATLGSPICLTWSAIQLDALLAWAACQRDGTCTRPEPVCSAGAPVGLALAASALRMPWPE